MISIIKKRWLDHSNHVHIYVLYMCARPWLRKRLLSGLMDGKFLQKMNKKKEKIYFFSPVAGNVGGATVIIHKLWTTSFGLRPASPDPDESSRLGGRRNEEEDHHCYYYCVVSSFPPFLSPFDWFSARVEVGGDVCNHRHSRTDSLKRKSFT